LLRQFYDPFEKTLELANEEMEKVAPVETDYDCPNCGRKLLLRRGRFGEFFACSGYPECKTSMNVGENGEPVAREEKVAVEVPGLSPDETKTCDKCGKPMTVRTSRRGAFWGCTGYPKCRNIVPIEGGEAMATAAPQVELSEYSCPNCGQPLAMRKGRFGPFLGCTGYPQCKTIIKLDKEGKPKDEAVLAQAANGASPNGAADGPTQDENAA
jgi:DNA topoisomerase-1